MFFSFCNKRVRLCVSLKSIAMKQFFTMCLMLCSLAMAAQQTKVYNDPNAKVRNISAAFTKLTVSSGVKLYLTQSDNVSLAVSVSDSKYEERFKTEVVNGELKIYYDNKGVTWTNDKNRKLTAWLSVKNLEALRGSAGANVVVVNELNAPAFAMDFNSGAQFKGVLKTTSLAAEASSGANIQISGKADKSNIAVSSGAAFQGSDLVTQTCSASANSGAAVKVEVQKELQASANSGGSITYEGDAVVNRGKINSGGSVRKSN